MNQLIDQREPSPRGEWRQWVVVLVLAIALSLIGFRVASQVGPNGSPGQTIPPVAASADSSTTTSTVVGSPGVTAADEEASTTTTNAVEPASMSLSHEVVDFGEDVEAVEVTVANTAGGPASWSLQSESDAISMTPPQGQLAAGETETVTVSLDRAVMEEGELEATLTLIWETGEVQAGVTAVTADNPIIHNPLASPASIQVGGDACAPTRTTISARVRDTSELERVIARWSHDGSTTRETMLEPVGEDIYEGVIGPYEIEGSDSVRVLAYDIHGNAGGATITVTITPCA